MFWEKRPKMILFNVLTIFIFIDTYKLQMLIDEIENKYNKKGR